MYPDMKFILSFVCAKLKSFLLFLVGDIFQIWYTYKNTQDRTS